MNHLLEGMVSIFGRNTRLEPDQRNDSSRDRDQLGAMSTKRL
ncbi:hypothetical protein B005_2003 [Nocardiopsis alba ATCC BAA-2165]|uniref:Uncharacterized protein n=1 Tax=Nocardiopsis alba (strain ATCC BAA-2165 / BE74) TaxID=1205910 RepID=J7LB55_NOCAA|nr:hypothetical protein B005_2003 [Nocardiopsis alba ATCC BAA-2165]